MSSGVKKLDTIEYKGTKNKTINPEFINLCKLSKKKLQKYLAKELKKYYPEQDVINSNVDGYIYARGTEKVLLTAHLDTVHNELVKDFYEDKVWNQTKLRFEHIVSSPQGIGGDDRCGVYMILQILKNTEFRPYILFCQDEEIGGVGSMNFTKTKYINELKELKFFLELDRCNGNDAVFYNCGNKAFQKFITEDAGYELNYGSFSDISNLSPATDVASVNLSCGYYKQHTLGEYVNLEEMADNISAVAWILEASSDAPMYDYQEVISDIFGRRSYFDWDDESWYKKEKIYGLSITFKDREGNEAYDYFEAESFEECMGYFFLLHTDRCWNDVTDVEEINY